MFYLTSQENPTLSSMKGQTAAPFAETEDHVLSQYQMTVPFKLETYAFHPDDPDHFFSMTVFSPDDILYATLSREDMQSQREKIRLHKHNYYELMLVLEGEMYQLIENQRYLYRPGSCCLLNKNVYHTEEHTTTFRVAFLDLREDFLLNLMAHTHMQYFRIEKKHQPAPLEEFLMDSLGNTFSSDKKYMNFFPRKDSVWMVSHVHHIFEEIAAELLNPRAGSSYRTENLVIRLFDLLSDRDNFDDIPIQIGSDKENALFQSLSEILLASGGHISRRKLAEELHYSADYLNKICRKYSGLCLYDYGMSFCMQKAARLLTETNLPVETIALSLGFSNRTNFYKQFHAAYRMTPAKYRKKDIGDVE